MDSPSMDSKIKIIIIAVVVAIIGAIGISAMDNSSGSSSGPQPQIAADPMKRDFGDISMANGKVTYTVKVENKGEGDLEIKKLYTSCMCTVAKIKIDGKESPEFGMPGMGASNPFWSGKIAAGKSADLDITFDPNAHGPNGVGPIDRVITLETNDPNHKRLDLRMTANVIR